MEGLAESAFRRHHAQIYHYLRRRTNNADLAEDLTQEVFADAAAALSHGNWRPASMLAWLHTIAQRRFADEVRRRRDPSDGVPLDEVLDEVPARDYGPDLAPALREAILRLSPNQQQIICMKLLRGSSFCDIASTMELTEAAAKMRFQRALKALRADLERQGIAP